MMSQGHSFPNIRMYVCVDGDTVYCTHRHILKDPATAHASLASYELTAGTGDMNPKRQADFLACCRRLDSQAAAP